MAKKKHKRKRDPNQWKELPKLLASIDRQAKRNPLPEGELTRVQEQIRSLPGTVADVSICAKCPRYQADKPDGPVQFHYCAHWFGPQDDCMSTVAVTYEGKQDEPTPYRIPKDCNFKAEQVAKAAEGKR